ncbi:MAG: DNA polymerase III subunit gamma/tau [Clostridia bacterium]|nr:DNA polymerase III subunit gamma/tau [Clostridia bacterium]
MAYQAIYRKWRPTTFEDVVGQSHITETLKTEIKTSRLAHAYLFCGTRGTGKTTTAKILSRAVNCENPMPDGNPCNECPSCKGILSNTIMDVVEIDAASNNGVDNIRELRDEISYTPANVKYKIYIIDEVHMLSAGAFNALLKTLEEPPAHAIFILATTEAHKIPATIQSRCQRFDFRRISAKNIAGRIGEITRKDNINIAQDAIRLVAQLGDGSMRDALSILDLCSGIEGEITLKDIENVTGAVSRASLIDLSVSLINGDISKSISLIDKMLESGRETGTLLDELIMCFREILICKIMDNPSDVVDKSDEDIEVYKNIAKSVSNEVLLHIIKVLSETAGLCKTSTNPRVMLEASAVKICDPSADPSSDAFAARLAKIESMISTGSIPVAKPEPIIVPAVTEKVRVATEEAFDTPPFDIGEPEVIAEKETEEIPVEPPIAEDDDEEYVCESEDYSDEDIPPFDIPDFGVVPPMEQPMIEETLPIVEEEVTNTETISDSIQSADIASLTDTMMLKNPALGSILKQATLKIKDGVYFVVFQEEIFKNTINDNKDFVTGIKNALNCEHLKIVTEKELAGQSESKDPLDDIISMADSVDQISIF